MEEKIKELYNCKKINGDDPLITWYNQVIDKRVSELTVSDVARCIRQDLFVKTAYEVLLAYLLNNPYEGDLYAGELIEKASQVDKTIITKHKSTIDEIIDNAKTFMKTHNWENEEDKRDFEIAILNLAKKIK